MSTKNRNEYIHPYKQFAEELRNDGVPPVVLFFGEEEYLIKLAVGELVKKYVTEGMEAFDYLCYDKASTAEEPVLELIDQCDMYSFSSQKKIVWLKDFPLMEKSDSREVSKREAERVLSYAQNPCDGSILVISHPKKDDKSGFYKEVAKIGKAYNFAPLSHEDLVSFLKRRFALSKVKVPGNLIKLIIDESGYFTKESTYRLYNLCMDVEKIIAHADGSPISEADILETLHGHLDAYIFHFIDGISKRNKEQAFEVLQNILSSEQNVYGVVNALINHFEFLLSVWELKNLGASQAKIASELRAHSYRVGLAYNLCGRFSKAQIKDRLSQLYEIDRLIKSGEMGGELALELFLWKA